MANFKSQSMAKAFTSKPGSTAGSRLFGQKSSKWNDAEMFDLVQKKAYELFEKNGCLGGNDIADWLEAERLVKKQMGLK